MHLLMFSPTWRGGGLLGGRYFTFSFQLLSNTNESKTDSSWCFHCMRKLGNLVQRCYWLRCKLHEHDLVGAPAYFIKALSSHCRTCWLGFFLLLGDVLEYEQEKFLKYIFPTCTIIRVSLFMSMHQKGKMFILCNAMQHIARGFKTSIVSIIYFQH